MIEKTELDGKLLQIASLKWLPWVGMEYLKNGKGILIVGESHYHDNTTPSISKHNASSFTREVIKEMAIERCYESTKVFSNFHRAVLGNDEFDANKFWNRVSFYNFIQKPMVTNKSRPSHQDFYDGWKTFFEVIQILAPSTCIFIGATAANSFGEAIKESIFTSPGIQYEDLISNTYARRAIIEMNGVKMKLVFIQHTSARFSWSKWNVYLNRVLPEEIGILQSTVSNNVN